ncbi:MauE/DoxX family redox-associated membrane protein [Thalassiella azotivora]
MVGLVAAGALLLLVAGAPKVLAPEAGRGAVVAARLPLRFLRDAWVSRASGAAEVVVALAVLLVGGPWPLLALAVTYGVLAAFSWRVLRVSPGASCGCFGRASTPVSRWHVGTNAGLALVALLALGLHATGALASGSYLAALGDQPWAGVPLLALTALLAYACYLLMTALPALLQAGSGGVPVR